jgi:uncharacterized Zn finger protein (UPF0148 family)
VGVRKVSRCRECGAQLPVGPAPCPLCGAEASPEQSKVAKDAADYQADVRQLREQLKKLREVGAKAV